MSGWDDLVVVAELRKLERLLDVRQGDLAHLEQLGPVTLRALREQVEATLHGQAGDALHAILAASRLLPDRLVASIAERTFPPVLTAQLAGLLEPERAAALVGHFSTGYLASLAAHVAPDAIAPIVPRLPRPVLLDVAAEVDRRGDHLTAGRLVGLAPDDALGALVAAIPDAADLVEIACLLEAEHRLGDIAATLPDQRVDDVLRTVDQRGWWGRALALAERLPQDQLVRARERARVLDLQPPDRP